VAPLFTLLIVGLSFLISRGIVLQLVDQLNFIISDFTNIFLILVLFGIGTDYTLLLLMRFKEELYKGLDKNKAIVNTFKTAGKTVFLSSLTILISSSSLMLAQFKPNRSASAVTVGVGVLLLLIFSFLPAMMKLFGKHIFWSPFRISGHADSPLWEKTATLSTKRPYVAILFVLMVCGLIVFYNENLSYNHLKEVGKDYPSVKGFNIVSKHFTIGKALPVSIVIQNKGKMDNPFKLSELDVLTETLKSVKGVDGVYSVTQPKGERIKALYINDQTATVRDGLKKATDGIDKLYGGVGSALEQIRSKELDFSPVEKLQKGTQEMTSGIELVHKSVDLLKNGMNSGAQASKDLVRGIELLDDSMTQLKNSFPELKKGYASLGQGYQQIGVGMGQLLEQTKRFQAAFRGVIDMQSQLLSRHPELAADDTLGKWNSIRKYFIPNSRNWPMGFPS
jgi:RND superfamily putative drug exporter